MISKKIILPFLFTLSMIFFFSTPIKTAAQNRMSPNVDSFLEQTIQYYFTTPLAKSPDSEHLIRKDRINEKIKRDYTSFKILLASDKEIYDIIGHKKGHNGWYYKTAIIELSNDTLDVVVIRVSVSVKSKIFLLRKRQISLFNSCRGTNGYIPDSRFIYNRQSNKWVMYNYDELLAIKREKK